MKKNIVFFFGLFFIIACNNEIKITEDSKTDITEILIKSISINEFKNYLHTELEDRKVIGVLENNVLKDYTYSKVLPKPFKYVDSSSLCNSAIEFNSIVIVENLCKVNFLYKIEGVRLEVEFIKKNDEWIIKTYNLVER